MKSAIFIFLMCTACPAFAAEGASVVKSETDSLNGWNPWLVEVRGGLVTSNPDNGVLSRWEHQASKSYAYSAGVRRYFPQAWRRLRFYGGAEYQTLTAREELNGSYRATIDITIHELLAEGGVAMRWDFGGAGAAGFRVGTRFTVWGEKMAKLDAQGFTQNLGRENVNWGSQFGFLPAGFYELGPCTFLAALELRQQGTTFTIGAGYAF